MQIFYEQINQSSEDQLLKKTQEQHVQLVLGNPKCGCKGTGICKVELLSAAAEQPLFTCRSISAIARLQSRYRMSLTIEKKELTDCIRRHFAGNRLVVPHAVCLSRQLASLWQVPGQQVLPGIYRIVASDESLSFDLKLAVSRQKRPEHSQKTLTKYVVEKP